jgi:hypothetical protein
LSTCPQKIVVIKKNFAEESVSGVAKNKNRMYGVQAHLDVARLVVLLAATPRVC